MAPKLRPNAGFGLAIVLLAGGSLGACSGGPGALGITGPTANPERATTSPPPPGAVEDSVIAQPGLPADIGDTYGSSTAPTYGRGGRFYGYN